MRLIRHSFSILRCNLTILWILFGVKLVIALTVCLPLLVMTDGVLTSSVFANVMKTEWSFDVMSELGAAHNGTFSMFVMVLLATAALAFLAKQFLNGGIYRALLGSAPFDRDRFFAGGAELFGGNLRISGLMILLYILLFLIALIFWRMVPGRIIAGFGKVALIPTFLRIVLMYVIMIFGSILSDLMRFHLAEFSSASMQERIRYALRRFISRFFALNGAYYVWFLPFLIIWMLIEWLALQVTGGLNSLAGVVIELLLFQICSVLRTGQSLLSVAGVGIAADPSKTGAAS